MISRVAWRASLGRCGVGPGASRVAAPLALVRTFVPPPAAAAAAAPAASASLQLCSRPKAAAIAVAPPAAAALWVDWRGSIVRKSNLYWKLAKGKLTVWVALSSLPGYFLALQGAVDPAVLAALAVGTVLTSSSAQTMNQLIEIDRDARMKRTEKRPLPSGQLSQKEAAAFGAVCGSSGLAVLCAGATPATAAVAGATMVAYAGIYTPLKVRSPYNTHVGAISGSLPTLLGFTAALGGAGLLASPWALHAAWLFAMQTLWQMPHFYALAWLHRADYVRGGYDMFPLTDSTGHATAAMSKPYLVALCTMPWAASACGLASWMLPVGAAVPCALWWRSLKAFERKPSPATCRRFFLGSLSYLLVMLGLFTCYAHVEEPAVSTTALAEKTPSGQTVEEPSEPVVRIYGPAWRAALHAQLLEVCPHEKARHWFFGIARDGCPFASGKAF